MQELTARIISKTVEIRKQTAGHGDSESSLCRLLEGAEELLDEVLEALEIYPQTRVYSDVPYIAPDGSYPFNVQS